MKKIAVCGGAGFLGSWLCQKLVDEGHYAVSFDVKMPEFGFAPAHEYFIFDLRNPVEFYAQHRWHEFDEVYQLAADMGGAEHVFSGRFDAEIMHNSATINLHVLEACRIHGVKRVLFTSSACVYPSNDNIGSFISMYLANGGYNEHHNLGCREEDAGDADSAYGKEKWFSEALYDSYRRNHGIETRIARVHNAFGEYGTWRGGREKSPAAFMRKIAELGPGGSIDCFGDGNQTRSFIHASEAVEGFYRLMQSDCAEPVNIGSSEMVSINQMMEIINTIAGGKSIHVRYIEGPLGVRGRNSDNTLCEKMLGWKPTQTLRAGLERTYPWIAEQVAKVMALDGTKTTT